MLNAARVLFSIFLLSTITLPAIAAVPIPSPAPSNIWKLTVYYTAVESFHHQRSVKVYGCREMGCRWKATLGQYPADFVKAVKDEGTGRITHGEHSGKYLCWSKHDGYWLDTIPRNAQDTALNPWESAAADPSVMNYGSTFQVIDCGVDDTDSSEINAKTCTQIKSARWKIVDRFEPGLGGKNHLDLYIGEEDQDDFIKSSPKMISVKAATISFD
jgi:hypothetical protein